MARPLSLQTRSLAAAGIALAAFLCLAFFALDQAFFDAAMSSQRERLQGYLHAYLAGADTNRAGNLIPLTPKEFGLLAFLIKNEGRVVSKYDIMEQVWDLNFDSGTNVVEVYINFLRKKIDRNYEPKLIHTKPGMGYYVAAN